MYAFQMVHVAFAYNVKRMYALGTSSKIAPCKECIVDILPRFLLLGGTGSLRRLSLDISNVPDIVVPPRGTQLLAN